MQTTEVKPTPDPDVSQFEDTRPKQAAMHPLLMGLWDMLPEPGPGNYTPEQQAEWIEAAKVNLKLLYGGPRPAPRVASSHGETPVRPSAANEES